MQRAIVIGLGLLSLAAGSGLTTSVAHAGFPVEVKATCAIGGKRFKYTTTGSYTIYGVRSDGKPYGSWNFPLALPVCPDNGLVMYREFTAAELVALPTLIDSPEYVAMRRTDTPRFRAAWLERRLSPGSGETAWLILAASWEADDKPDLKRRYQEAFVLEASSVKSEPSDLEWLFLQARLANALRELGRFDEASERLHGIPRAPLDVVAPERTPDNYEAWEDAAGRRGLLEFLDQLAVAITRRDTRSELLDLMNIELATRLCEEAAMTLEDEGRVIPLAPDGACENPAIKAQIAKDKAWLEGLSSGDDQSPQP